jgi:hypothetical protein
MQSAIFRDVTLAVDKYLQMFRNVILPPSSGSKYKQSKKQATDVAELKRICLYFKVSNATD